MSVLNDDRLEHVVPFVLQCLKSHRAKPDFEDTRTPLVLGVNGVQGCGKSTLVDRLRSTFGSPPYSLNNVVFSIDDFYLTNDQQALLASSHPDNPLIQHRGQPSTHDVDLCARSLASLRRNERTELPVYDKSAFAGQGDRRRDQSILVDPSKKSLDLVVIEGWFVGFRPLSKHDVEKKWLRARVEASKDLNYAGRLGHNKLEDILFVNEELERYNCLTNHIDALVHIDAEDTLYVYDWRLEAEHESTQRNGSGMSDTQVKTFVDGYYPSYELYTEALRSGVFHNAEGRQLRLVVDRHRRVVACHRM